MFYLGIDFGTSGARAIAIDADQTIVATSRAQFAPNESVSHSLWQRSLWQLLEGIDAGVRSHLSRIAINGTSATVLLCDRTSQPLVSPLLYNDLCARSLLPDIQQIAPPGSPTLSATSSLAKALWWHRTLDDAALEQVAILCHQADWLAGLLHGQTPVSDYHNALKLGYDVRALQYPRWLQALPIAKWFPDVKTPGDAIAPISPAIAQRFSIPPTCQICAGTTDSIAAFLASGASREGEAMTSLGSTLVLKLLSSTPVDDQKFGIYSHRLGDLWLVGGASNTGGVVLQQYFSPDELAALSLQIDLSQPCELDYYPLTTPGERFPVNDPDYSPRLTPRPERDVDFLYGMLAAIARIESEGYQKLNALGAPAVNQVLTAGGGAQNQTWQALRSRRLGIPVSSAVQTEAAFGSAKLALLGLAADGLAADGLAAYSA
ncbi:MAG: FGGY-family carbohydrate kinase [Cyanobacteria bacterium J06629_19]